MTLATIRQEQVMTTMDSKTAKLTSLCACGNPKRASKQICTTCSFLQYIKSTNYTIPTKVCACGSPKKPGALCCTVCDGALQNYIETRTKREGANFSKAQLKKYMNKRQGIGVAGKCSLCDGNYIFGGNNPQPILDDYDARCCDDCNHAVVAPVRFDNIKKYGRAY